MCILKNIGSKVEEVVLVIFVVVLEKGLEIGCSTFELVLEILLWIYC
jgi:hypothetical protein